MIDFTVKKRNQQKLIALTILLFCLFNIPFLTMFDKGFTIYGFPLIYFYIFVVWLLAIIVSYIVLKRFYE